MYYARSASCCSGGQQQRRSLAKAFENLCASLCLASSVMAGLPICGNVSKMSQGAGRCYFFLFVSTAIIAVHVFWLGLKLIMRIIDIELVTQATICCFRNQKALKIFFE